MIRSLFTNPRMWRVGLTLGVMGGGAWVAGRLISKRFGDRLVNWEWAAQVAALASRSRTPEAPWDRRQAQQQYADYVRRSHDLVAEYTGVTLPQPLTNVRTLDRREWVEANVANFRVLFDLLEQDVPGGAQAHVGRRCAHRPEPSRPSALSLACYWATSPAACSVNTTSPS